MVVIAGAASVLWITGIMCLLTDRAPEVQRLGIVLVVGAATVTLLGLLHSWQMRMRRAFVHGYHAGFHDASRREQPRTARTCDVLELSEEKARRLARMN